MFPKLRRRLANNPSSVTVPLAHLVTSNYPPSDAEETLVRSTIQAMRGEITALQLQIDNYSSHLGSINTLQDRKATIIKDITAHESIISPLRKLPPELLRVIFQKTYWDPATTFTLPWSLSQVCRSWRTVAHATPILWSCITIDFSTKPTKLRSQEDKLKLILQRSAYADLRISIRGAMKQGDKRLSLLLILIAHSERWRYLNLELTITTETIMALRAVHGHLPRLSQLHLKFRRLDLPITGITIDMFGIAPRLETVVINNVLRSVAQVIVPLNQLNSYVSKTFPCVGSGLNTSLAAFSNLVHFETYWENAIGPQEPCITFPRLKVLVITFSFTTENSADGFFERLTLPSISEIIVLGQASDIVHPLSSMISRSLPCNLRTLSITTTNLENPGDLRSLLLLTPQLKYLRIPHPSHLDLPNLFAASGNQILLPKLQSLHVAVSTFILDLPSFSSPVDTFIAARVEISSNVRARSRLKTLQLNFLTEVACRNAYFAVQPFPQVDELDRDVLALIKSWKNRLVEDIPHLSCRPTPRRILINLMHWHRLDQLFNAIEGYDIPTSGSLHVRHSLSPPRTLRTNLWGKLSRSRNCIS